jgi:hypothetical protein
MFAHVGNDLIHHACQRDEGQPHEKIIVISKGNPFVEADGSRDIASHDHCLQRNASFRRQHLTDERAFARLPWIAEAKGCRSTPLIDQTMPSITPAAVWPNQETSYLSDQLLGTPPIIGIEKPDECPSGRPQRHVPYVRDVTCVLQPDNVDPLVGRQGHEAIVCRPIVRD